MIMAAVVSFILQNPKKGRNEYSPCIETHLIALHSLQNSTPVHFPSYNIKLYVC